MRLIPEINRLFTLANKILKRGILFDAFGDIALLKIPTDGAQSPPIKSSLDQSGILPAFNSLYVNLHEPGITVP
jgi:hypothetical protein